MNDSFRIPVELIFQDNYATTKSDSYPDQSTWQDWVRSWLTFLQDYLPAAESYELSLRLTTDTEIQFYNREYRHKDQPTDVLAFAALEVDNPIPDEDWHEPLYLGDIIISVDTADKQARQQGHGLTHELTWLTAHGILHLLGWDHPDDSSLEEMLSLQETLLKLLLKTPSEQL
ncbi:MAG: Endoribonuclease YbeY [Chroococcopsis gigantea SAG 12.99]|jgi:probable rRNA maturation factor|nr:rRNA maturation RNase YbeY [Chlorogloea purpurea SAG 13.99]MDV3002356.1 Endoribonuclease YbeY [Chroococcopsis gigantea SAG 12.99]